MARKSTRTHHRRGISEILTTLIILVASIVSAAGVVMYGTSLFQGGVLQEDIAVRGTVMWVDPADVEPAWGAAAIRNSGDVILSLDTIKIRGSDVPVANWYVDKDQTRISVVNYQAQFNHTGYSGSNGMLNNYDPDGDCSTGDLKIDQDGAGGESALCLTQGVRSLLLNPNERMVIYFKIPSGLVASIDAGKNTAVSFYAGSIGSPQSITISTP